MLNETRIQSVIFDLDGTLIDSAPGIFACFDRILCDAGIKALLPLDDKLIGPPLRQTLKMLTGVDADTELDRLVQCFKDAYDTEGYLLTRVYQGVEDLLAALHFDGIPMAIATNKRLVPALKIVETLGWERYFPLVGTLDMCSPPHSDKATLIAHLLVAMGLDRTSALYVGDKYEDGEAAQANGIPFFAAGWGYGEWDAAHMPSGWTLVSSSSELIGIAGSAACPTVVMESVTREIESI